jgi:transposase
MEAMVERCCGLDVHQAQVTACLLVGGAGRRPKKEVRRFGTFTRDLLALRDWLREAGCTHVAMESTGVYWKPVYAVLEEAFELVVGNAFHIKNVPGRKTDVGDAEWIADLLRHGLIAKSFVPPQPVRELRDLMRYRSKLVESRAAERNRLLRLLETANIKISSVATDVFGRSGMNMLEAITAGHATPETMANMAIGRMRSKIRDLEGALDGRVGEHHRFLLRLQLDRLKAVEADLAKLGAYIDARLEPYRTAQRMLQTIPGIGVHTATAILSEIGGDVSAFPSAKHFAAWVGVCPGNNESAGKKMRASTRKGNRHLRKALVEATLGAVRKGGSYLKAKYYKLKARCGVQRAAIAIAHKLAIAVYHVLAKGEAYADLGEAHLDKLASPRTARHLVRRLESLGYRVQLEPLTPLQP